MLDPAQGRKSKAASAASTTGRLPSVSSRPLRQKSLLNRLAAWLLAGVLAAAVFWGWKFSGPAAVVQVAPPPSAPSAPAPPPPVPDPPVATGKPAAPVVASPAPPLPVPAAPTASVPPATAAKPEAVVAALPPAATGNSSNQPLAEPPPLLIPVQGALAKDLRDSFFDGRDANTRGHEAIDIMAPTGTPVFAVDDGKIAKLFLSKPGGITLYQFDSTGTFAYYYSHLDAYAPGIAEGQLLKRGQLLGYVGATGNARVDAPHLHFAIFRLGTEKKWWQGEPINPFGYLGGKVP